MLKRNIQGGVLPVFTETIAYDQTVCSYHRPLSYGQRLKPTTFMVDFSMPQFCSKGSS